MNGTEETVADDTELTTVGGIEDTVDSEPYAAVNERKVLIQQYDYAVRTLIDMVLEEDLLLNPDYQRQYRWDDLKASRFIESILLNIPVPVIYLAEEKDGTFSVIDGQQRLTSLLRFIKPDVGEEFRVDGLKVRADINGLAFDDLERSDKSAITKRPIRCIVVLNESDQALKFEVFERLNTGSSKLTDQEVRNCIYHGNFNDLIKKLAVNEHFLELISLPEKNRNNMKAEELVLRFFAYRDLDDGTDYPGGYTEYLNNYMEYNRSLPASRIEELRNLFNDTVELIYSTLGARVAFRRPIDQINPDRFAHTLINGAIYESQMIVYSKLIEDGIQISDLRERTLSSFAQDRYWGSLFQGTAKKATAIKRSAELLQHIAG
ncbi:DUF262 domain-containing protein [Pseudomonas iridis]|uniref:DUF262 domain-containing protein n=1 Tax=Pseudomonas iridis TaxID=2710587 RepID=UPI0037CA192D